MRTSKLFKVLSFTLPVTITGSLFAVSCSNSNTFEVEIEIPKGSGIEFSNHTATIGQKFESDITSPIEIYGVSVTVDDFHLPDHAIVFTPLNEQYKYYFKIFGSYVTSKKITIDVITEPLVDSFKISFDAGEGVIAGTSQSIIDLEFDEEITWDNILNKPDGYLKDHNFDGWTLTKGSNDPVPGTHLFTGNETVYAIYSDCEHEFDSYSIEEISNDDGTTTRWVWGHCSECGSTVKLNNEQLKALEGYVLVKEDDTYRLSDSLAYEIQYAASTSVDIYLLYGTYVVFGTRIGSVVAANLHGVHDSNGNMVSSLDCYYEESIGTEKIYSALGVELYCDNMILAGKTNADLTWQGGIQCNHLLCKYCLVTGAQAAYSDTCTFLNCDFDSTNVISTDGSNTDYSVFLYNRYATFHDCNFRSNGKALKIYSHGAKLNNSYEILRCNFSIVNRINPKACINVDSSHQPVTGEYQVYVYQCQQIEGYEGELIYEDYGGHTVFHNSPRP